MAKNTQLNCKLPVRLKTKLTTLLRGQGFTHGKNNAALGKWLAAHALGERVSITTEEYAKLIEAQKNIQKVLDIFE